MVVEVALPDEVEEVEVDVFPPRVVEVTLPDEVEEVELGCSYSTARGRCGARRGGTSR